MILEEYSTKKDIEIKTIEELKNLLMRCNPTVLNFYKDQLKILKPDIEVKGFGAGLKLFEEEKEDDN